MGYTIFSTASSSFICISSNYTPISSPKTSISLSFPSVSRINFTDVTASLIRKKCSSSAFSPFPMASVCTALSPVAEDLSLETPGPHDLLIVGPGVLGRLVAERWKMDHPDCQIVGETVTRDHHTELVAIGINPSLKGTILSQKFPYVIFCAPPSQSDDYVGDLRVAALKWSGQGSFLFTSSSAVYNCINNDLCNEDAPIVPLGRSPRTDVLLMAEEVVLGVGGSVLRLAGLYTADRGPHLYWLSKGTVDVRPDYFLNLIHYEDAASLAVAILNKKTCCQIYLGCDNHPLSRQEIMDLVNKSGKYDQKFHRFIGISGPLGKKINNSRTRDLVGWEPKYPSFAQFLGVS